MSTEEKKTVTFMFTFGVKYHREQHPLVDWAHPDGYLEVIVPDTGDFADDYEWARSVVKDMIGQEWAFQYLGDELNRAHHPLGALATWQDGQLTVHRRFRQTMEEVQP